MATQDSRIKIKRSTVTATVPTVPSSNDHTDGTWIATDIYKGELFFNQADGVLWTRDDNGVNCIGGSASLTIASADVLTLNTTPLTIVPAVAGKTISVIGFSRSVNYGTTAYATNTHLQLKTAGANVGQVQQSNSLAATTSSHWNDFDRVTPTAGQTQLLANADLQVFVPTGNPTAGDSDITVYVHYRYI
jgi:hypothetical protein